MIALSEMSPFAFHLCNVVLHSIMTILLFALLQKMGACTSTAFFASLIASAHPIMVNIVASVAGRATLLAGIFSLASVCLYLSAEKTLVRLLQRSYALLLRFSQANPGYSHY